MARALLAVLYTITAIFYMAAVATSLPQDDRHHNRLCTFWRKLDGLMQDQPYWTGYVIECLRAELAKLDRAIAQIESLNSSQSASAVLPKKRGRKSMGPAERKEVSARLKRYWATRRKHKSS